MKVYVASHYAEKELSKELRAQVIAAGHECTSKWLDETWEKDPEDHETRQKLALMDLENVLGSDVMLLRNPVESHRKGTGGRRVEFGFAVGIGMPILILGKTENIFDDLPRVTICEDMKAVFAKLEEYQKAWQTRRVVAVHGDEYQKWVKETAVYRGDGPGSASAIYCRLLGKIGELGETTWPWLVRAMDAEFPNKALKQDLTAILLDLVGVARKAEALKRPIRDGTLAGFCELPPLTEDEKNEASEEAGDEVWQHVAYLNEIGLFMSEVVWGNVIKLTRRLRNGTVFGHGNR